MCWELPKLPEVKAHRSKVSVGVHLLLLGSADYDGPTRLLRDLPSNVYCYDPLSMSKMTGRMSMDHQGQTIAAGFLWRTHRGFKKTRATTEGLTCRQES